MQKLHSEGPELSRIVLGAWRWADQPLSVGQLSELVNRSVELGITSIDHADIYGNYECESRMGAILEKDTSLRDKIQLITKCGIKMLSDKYPDRQIGTYDTSSTHILNSVDNSLKALRTDFIDLLLIHRPDPLMDPDEVATAFDQLRSQGKVRHFGVSNFTIQQFELLQSRLGFPLVTNQIELSLTHNAPVFDGSIDHLYRHQVSPMAWSPFGGGDLFANHDLMEELKPMALKYDVSIAALALAWLLTHPSTVFPVVGTTKIDRLEGLAKAGDVSMEKEDWFMMLKAARGYDVP